MCDYKTNHHHYHDNHHQKSNNHKNHDYHHKAKLRQKVVLKNVSYRTAFDLTPYNDQKIRSITLQFQGSIPNSGGCLVLGNCWNEQHPIAYSDLQNGTITFQIQNPQDVMTIYNYYGLGSLQAVTLNY